MSDFPYKIICHPSDAQKPGDSATRKTYLGYRGWRPNGLRRPLRGPLPLPSIVDRSEWSTQIAAIGDSHLGRRFPLPAKHQNGLGYCWCYGSTRALEVERQVLGLPNLDLCPESVGGPCTAWRNEGGYAAEYFGQAERDGVAESRLCPRPHLLDPRLWSKDWQANAKSHLVARWFDIEQDDRRPTFDELVTCLLSPATDAGGRPAHLLAARPVAIGLPWWNHLVCALAALELPPETDCPVNTPDGRKVGVLIQNSWGPDWPTPGANGYAVLVESLATPDGAACPILET